MFSNTSRNQAKTDVEAGWISLERAIFLVTLRRSWATQRAPKGSLIATQLSGFPQALIEGALHTHRVCAIHVGDGNFGFGLQVHAPV